jgi:ankyrin repeat protein
MVDLLYELGASLDIKNRQGLTPLTLAAVKAHKDVRIFCFFLSKYF